MKLKRNLTKKTIRICKTTYIPLFNQLESAKLQMLHFCNQLESANSQKLNYCNQLESEKYSIIVTN